MVMKASGKLIILDPTVAPTKEESRPAPRLDNFEGAAIGLLENTKGNARPLLVMVGEMLQQRNGAGEIIIARKPTFGRVAPKEIVDDLVDRCDLVLTALGD